MWKPYQILIIAGLFFEFISVLIVTIELFYGYYKRLEKGTVRQEIRKEKIKGASALICLSVGMILQGIAVFL